LKSYSCFWLTAVRRSLSCAPPESPAWPHAPSGCACNSPGNPRQESANDGLEATRRPQPAAHGGGAARPGDGLGGLDRIAPGAIRDAFGAVADCRMVGGDRAGAAG